ncbi:MAG: hypothetical protein UX09_C0004G0025 [Candidatus Uhrbacteria bacterium GW2011_GWE2_45_35]|uniref:Radical SAM core domain-containing protein n=2 Tax=Candidatus Uhriibacteriota TaxID=1752732 RepID=A0A0G1JKX2_9BACT|nr:MAG: hypothetical protein UW63_C0002G0003 [Candidatus Uhrbacteria bacterium GW2011_GWF2_44_350]KKU09105.1 MAG: hypothetical protein UX09_C0004G0025 [Candidatus Uhrbacteria bacterium GW2011_GWE2_45_35]HBR80356.1 hypothetical protein [Candidatus Uhrbacteria bacterium]HCU31277.1 hypothetical protein [Candidatus Uhrbacteria bacterium]
MNDLKYFYLQLDKLKKTFKSYVFTAAKWQNIDVLPGYSDLDIRFVIETGSEDEIMKFSAYVGAMFVNLRNHSLEYSRLFEHSPGFIYLKHELEKKLGLQADIFTWRFLHGKHNVFNDITRSFLKPSNKNQFIPYFQSIIENRLNNYSLEKEVFYNHLSTEIQKKYFIVYHYYLVVLYATGGLLSKTWPKSKTSNLQIVKKTFPELKLASRSKLLNLIRDEKISSKKLLDKIENDFSLLKNDIFFRSLLVKKTRNLTLENEIESLVAGMSMLRARLHRYCDYDKNYYQINIKQLIREKNDFESMCNYFDCFLKAQKKPSCDKPYFISLHNSIRELEKFKNLDFSSQNTYKETSQYLLNNFYKIENAVFQILHHYLGSISIDCLKIKILSRCSRMCSFCIFSNDGKKDMPFDKFINIINKFNEIHFNKIFINGGEPTLYPQIDEIGEYLKNKFPHKELVLGTNCTIINRSEKIFQSVLKHFDTFAIGCDDEHRNITDVLNIVPRLRAANKTVVINTLNNYISKENDDKLKKLSADYGVVHVYNNLHHFCNGKKINKTIRKCSKLKQCDLMVTINGACFKCFNAVDETAPDFMIDDEDFAKKLFKSNKKPYKYCYYCDDYTEE